MGFAMISQKEKLRFVKSLEHRLRHKEDILFLMFTLCAR